jgi:hypothetical protein
MKAYGGVDIKIYVFLTSALVGVERSASRPGHFTPGTHWIGGWVYPSAGLDGVERKEFLTLSEMELRPLSRSVSSQSLYRLRYPGSYGVFIRIWYGTYKKGSSAVTERMSDYSRK